MSRSLSRISVLLRRAPRGLVLAAALLACVAGVSTPARARADGPSRCTYRSYSWSDAAGGPVNRERVDKPYSKVTDEERDPHEPRCTVCEADQREVDPASLGLRGIPPIKVCHVYRERVEAALRELARDRHFQVRQVVGYRSGRTRGALKNGVRTQFSNHSYGTAIDINASSNGLYASCDVGKVTPETIRSCRLRIGGRWDPAERPATTIVREGPVHRAFGRFWKWGGEIPGNLKDLMHFSITGY